ncbi:unnamed protein product [Symbiodinium sp. CCMP2592]|nr:unnamed protein product [Symbiodinium sp. CCMP2592]
MASRLSAATPEDMAAIIQASVELRPEDLARIPGKGEAAALQWKHNLGQGASADLKVPGDMASRLAKVAISAVDAIGMRFCSVDIIDVEGEGLMVMEVNGGVMMDSLMSQMGESGKGLAAELYEAAVLEALNR